MPRAFGWKNFPWEGVLVDLVLLAFWAWALPAATAWCLQWPHVAVWSLVVLQSLAVSRMVALFMAGDSPAFLGRLSPLGGLAAVLSAGGFLWLLGAMFTSRIECVRHAAHDPGARLHHAPGARGPDWLRGGGPDADRTRPRCRPGRQLPLRGRGLSLRHGAWCQCRQTRRADSRLVLCHLPIRFVFASVAPTSRYELLSAAVSFGVLLNAIVG